MKYLEQIIKALANKRRLAILKLMKNRKEASVGEIAEHIRLSFKATSKHLNIMARAEVLDKEQRSLTVFYSLSPEIRPFIKSLLDDL
ncbi:MAG: winged helix-turn-helix transcriptional regulator [Candidatus Doudnabacteria bacterium]|nr:winged helix-turn-helix transcriptional regulator [Candidatus Doudnabacteria bacterium]